MTLYRAGQRHSTGAGLGRVKESATHEDRSIINDIGKENKRTLCSGDVNDYGDFVRAYKTLEEAKAGALARCGWQGLNRETIIKKV